MHDYMDFDINRSNTDFSHPFYMKNAKPRPNSIFDNLLKTVKNKKKEERDSYKSSLVVDESMRTLTNPE